MRLEPWTNINHVNFIAKQTPNLRQTPSISCYHSHPSDDDRRSASHWSTALADVRSSSDSASRLTPGSQNRKPGCGSKTQNEQHLQQGVEDKAFFFSFGSRAISESRVNGLKTPASWQTSILLQLLIQLEELWVYIRRFLVDMSGTFGFQEEKMQTD